MPRTLDQCLPECRGLTSKWLILTQHLLLLQEQLLEGSESDREAGLLTESFKTKSNKKGVRAGNVFFKLPEFFSKSFLQILIIMVMFKKNKSSYILEMHTKIQMK